MLVPQLLLQLCSLLSIISVARQRHHTKVPFGSAYNDIQGYYHLTLLWIFHLKIWLCFLNSSRLWILVLCYASCQSKKRFPQSCAIFGRLRTRDTLVKRVNVTPTYSTFFQRSQNWNFEVEPGISLRRLPLPTLMILSVICVHKTPHDNYLKHIPFWKANQNVCIPVVAVAWQKARTLISLILCRESRFNNNL